MGAAVPPAQLHRVSGRLREQLPGLIVSALLATIAFVLADQPFFKDTLHVSALLLVILVGMAWRSFAPVPENLLPGIRTAQRPVLRWAVAGLGFRLSLGEILHIGGPALLVVVASTISSLAFGWWLARRAGMGEKMGILLGVGGAICGASAVVAADSVVQGERRDSALSLGIITLLGTIGILVYPLLGHALGMSDFLYGVWDGASLHEMAQVVAAGAGFSKAAVATATTVKLIRICLLAPVVFWLAWQRRGTAGTDSAGGAGSTGGTGSAKVAVVPWFLVLFVVFAAINSLGVIPKPLLANIVKGDTWLLCVGMAGVGLQTGFADLKEAGWKPILVGAAQWVFLAAVSYGLGLALRL